ncbi:uncharacterized protein LOC112904571 [Agrilus planipennis]|uniref:Uncharacterized protein LOC108740628 n=1 Tax=Agrilus planipennis TaxID=224129 RepID=A0A1W4XDS3_AGRPL|nr:uncharacterized protein LOC108740628 [Agrilus planipennis]XP_025830638.1 uncharacterized protein LOC112904571 [Agrilus planipennis]
MGGCRCSFRNCKSATKNCDSIHFFHYPVKNRARCKQWIENARRPEFFNLPEDQLRNKVVCELHFESKCFCNPTRKRLLHDAVPTLDLGCKEEDSRNNEEYEDHCIYNNVQVLPANADGTIFTVDTEGIQQLCESDEIDTYVYRNGVLTPVLKSETRFYCDNETIVYAVPEDVVQSYENSNSIIDNLSQESSNDATSSNINSHIVQDYPRLQENVFDINQTRHFAPLVKHENAQHAIDENKLQQENVICTEIEISSNEENSNTSSNFPVLKQTEKNICPKQNTLKRKRQIQKRILQKLNHHSQEINNIKNLLKSNLTFLPKKQLQNVALRVLEQSIPSTLYEIILKTLKKKPNKPLQNNDFFQKLYLTSPKAYHLLQEENWCIPRNFNKEDILNLQNSKSTQTNNQNCNVQSSQTCSLEGRSVKSVQTLDVKDHLTENILGNIESTTQNMTNFCTVGTQCFSEMVRQNTIGIQSLLDQALITQSTIGTQCSFNSNLTEANNFPESVQNPMASDLLNNDIKQSMDVEDQKTEQEICAQKLLRSDDVQICESL